MRITTHDLYCGAYILCQGGRLEAVRLTTGPKGRASTVFILAGDHVEELCQEFQSGQACVNVANFKAAMNHLKDVMFNNLRASGL